MSTHWNGFDANTAVGPKEFASKNLIRNEAQQVKILGDGEITKPLTVRANSFSKSAIEKIKKAGGTVEILK